MLLALLLTATALLPAQAGGSGKVFLTQEEALELAFPKAEVEKETVYLTKEQRAEVEELAGSDLDSAVVRRYTARDAKGRLLGHAYFDRHKVRTLPEVLMVVVGPDGKVKRLEVLAFSEPLDYLPKGNWYAQFLGRELDDELRIKNKIHNAAGATLTARATLGAVRRSLAVDLVLGAPAPEDDEEGGGR